MGEIEKIKVYIERTESNLPLMTPYQMNINEMLALVHMTADDAFMAVCIAFDYGRAKGYRAAKREVQRRGGKKNT